MFNVYIIIYFIYLMRFHILSLVHLSMRLCCLRRRCRYNVIRLFVIINITTLNFCHEYYKKNINIYYTLFSIIYILFI